MDKNETLNQNSRSDQYPADDIVRAIVDAVKSVSFGSVEVVIHDSQVVQIERREKLRFGKN